MQFRFTITLRYRMSDREPSHLLIPTELILARRQYAPLVRDVRPTDTKHVSALTNYQHP